MNKKVLIIHYEYKNSYCQKNLGLFARHMSKYYDVEFLTLKVRSYVPYDEKNIKIIEYKSNNYSSIYFWVVILLKLITTRYVWCYYFEKKYHSLMFIVAKLIGVRVVVSLDSFWKPMNIDNSKEKLKNWLFEKALNCSYRILYQSDELYELLPRQLKTKLTKYTVSYSEIFQPKADNIHRIVKNKDNLIIFSGCISPIKNIHLLICSYKQLKLQNAGWKLKIIGDIEDESYYDLLINMCKRDESISFTGFKTGNEYYHYFRRAKIFVLPSISEGQPNVIVEAMYWGCSVIATKQSNLGEFFDGRSIVQVDPENQFDLNDKLFKMIHYYDNNISIQLHNRVLEKYLFEKNINKIIGEPH